MNYAIQFSKKYAFELGYPGENIYIFLPEYEKVFRRENTFKRLSEKLAGVGNMTNRLDVKVHQTKSLCLALKLLHTNDTNYTTTLTHTCN